MRNYITIKSRNGDLSREPPHGGGWLWREVLLECGAMKAILHYFSGTGNTARAVQALGVQLQAAGYEVAQPAIDGAAKPGSEIPDLTVVAFPIWAWAAPHFVLDYARRLPKARGARAAVFATCGGFSAQGVGEMEHVLRRRGYAVVASGEAVYPDNWTLAGNPPQGEELAAALAKGDEAVQKFIRSCLSAQPERFHCAWRHQLWSKPVAWLFRRVGRRFMGKFFAVDDTCTGCGQCAAACPVRAIHMAGAPARPHWGAGCAGCYRCINLCPVRAIQVSVPRLAIHLGLNLALTVWWFFWADWLYRQVVPLPGIRGYGLAVLWALAIYVVLMLLQLTLVDTLLQWLEKRTALRRFFRSSYTKNFRRYRAPGFLPANGGAVSR